MTKDPKSLQFVGGDERDVALLRLQLRRARRWLSADWQLDDACPKPDLVVVDPDTLAGDAAWIECVQGGRPVVTVEGASGRSGDLPRNFDARALAAVLNVHAREVQPSVSVVAAGDDFFLMDFEVEIMGPGLSPELQESTAGPQGPGSGREDWDVERSLFHRDPAASPLDALAGIDLDNGVEFSAVECRSHRSRARSDMADSRVGRILESDDGARYHPSESIPPDTRRFPLIDFLEHDIFKGPCRLQWEDSPALVIDPKSGCFHCEEPLPALALLFRDPIPVGAFAQLTTADLQRVRALVPPQPTIKLRWAFWYEHARGRLPDHLDPGGRYQIIRYLELATDYPHAFRIATRMARPRKVHELAEITQSAIEEVYDVITAFEAIGYLRWELRDRLRGDSEGGGHPGEGLDLDHGGRTPNR